MEFQGACFGPKRQLHTVFCPLCRRLVDVGVGSPPTSITGTYVPHSGWFPTQSPVGCLQQSVQHCGDKKAQGPGMACLVNDVVLHYKPTRGRSSRSHCYIVFREKMSIQACWEVVKKTSLSGAGRFGSCFVTSHTLVALPLLTHTLPLSSRQPNRAQAQQIGCFAK